MTTQTIRLLLVHDTLLMYRMLIAALKNNGFDVVAHATSLDETVQLLESVDVDIVLVSGQLPQLGAPQVTEYVKSIKFSGAIVIIYEVEENVANVLRYIEAGASGCIFITDSMNDLITSTKNVFGGNTIISPEIVSAMMRRIGELSKKLNCIKRKHVKNANLTSRELDVLSLMRNGLSNKDIANLLVIEVGTVKNHIHNILKKINASNRKDASYYLRLENLNSEVYQSEASELIKSSEYIR